MFSSKESEYKRLSLSDIKVIELLISYRYKYGESLSVDETSPSIIGSSQGRNSEELIAIYMSLDQYMEDCQFNEIQLKMLKMIGEGYSQEEIAKELNLRPAVIRGRLNTIYSRISKENERAWRIHTYTQKLKLKTKTCSKCKKDLPATIEFFSHLNRTRDGFHSQCRKCKH